MKSRFASLDLSQGPGKPFLLWKELTSKVLLWTAGGTLFLSLVISLAELFSMLWKFLARNASFIDILKWIGFGIPKHIVDAAPVAFLFAIVFILSEWHANNELEAVFSAGISLQRFVLPLLLVSVLLCATEYFVTDQIAIPFLRERSTLQSGILRESDSRYAVPALMADKGKKVYTYRFYDEKKGRIYDISVIERDDSGALLRKISAKYASFENELWVFSDAIIYKKSRDVWEFAEAPRFSDPAFDEPPASFMRPTMDVRFMNNAELNGHIAFLKSAGLPAEDAEVEQQRRISFAFTPLVVVGLAAAFAGRFRKSIFLLSLLSSLSSATLYYVAQMLASLAAKARMSSAGLAIWSVMLLFAAASTVSYFKART
ncbi:LptF/LptG family permease [Rectinema subterraneum]|uniref:LptF/LptG family permease n=1 Tax=Rectinema subterraneum TaxID=2653714 RepID=UPI00131C1757|nr:LptF/LptG family permease [Rectinema subterraneum]